MGRRRGAFFVPFTPLACFFLVQFAFLTSDYE